MTPLGIAILLHYWSKPGDVERLDAPQVRDQCEEFVRLGLLRKATTATELRDGVYSGVRDALDCYVRALLEVPLPVMRWTMPDAASFGERRARALGMLNDPPRHNIRDLPPVG